MDWCLVLASQGIEVTPERNWDNGRWQLRVPAARAVSARDAIYRFQKENRRYLWSRELDGNSFSIHWAGLIWPAILSFFFLFQDRVYDAAIFDTAQFRQGQWWRAVTAVMMHGDLGHLAANASFGAITVGLAMSQLGPWPALFVTLLTGVAGNLFALGLRGHDYIGLGSSGAVMGALGIAAASGIHLTRGVRFARNPVFVIVGSAALLFGLFGLDLKADILAHLGGFIAGLAFGGIAIACGLPKRPKLSATMLLAVVGVAWGLALKYA
jgi:membrane associated rhomboid family serine protease